MLYALITYICIILSKHCFAKEICIVGIKYLCYNIHIKFYVMIDVFAEKGGRLVYADNRCENS